MEINKSRVRTLQVLAAAIVLFAIFAMLLSGQPVFVAVISGITAGGLTFMLTALILFAYWGFQSSFSK